MIRISAVVFFSDKSSREDSLNMSYEESHSGQNNLLNVSQRSDMGNQRIQNDSKKGENIFLPKYDSFFCIRHFDLSLMLCCKLHVTFISYKITYILQNENIFI